MNKKHVQRDYKENKSIINFIRTATLCYYTYAMRLISLIFFFSPINCNTANATYTAVVHQED